jgi:hypothetical protein
MRTAERVQAVRGWAWVRALRERLDRFDESAAGRYWRHLSTADFMNSSFAFAALAVISAFPFLAVSSAAVGGDIRSAIVARMGLNVKATHDVNLLFATGNQAVATLTWVSCIVLVGGAIGMASTLQNWYHRIYEQTPPKGLLRHLVYQVAGVAAFTLYISAEVWLFDRAAPWAVRASSSCSRLCSPCSSGGGRPTCSSTAASPSCSSSLRESRPGPASQVSASSPG